MLNQEKLLDKKTVIERYHFKKFGLEWLIRTRQIPVVKIGSGRGRIYFDPQDLDEWINKQKIKTINNRGGGFEK